MSFVSFEGNPHEMSDPFFFFENKKNITHVACWS